MVQETLNNMISIDPELSARLHMYYRSSPVARRQLGMEIVNNYGSGLPIEPVMTDKMTNRNVEILTAYLKIMGLELEFHEDRLFLPTNEEGRQDDTMYYHTYRGNHYIATPNYMLHQIARDKVKQRMDDNELGYIYIGHDGSEKEQFIDELIYNMEADIMDMGADEFFREEGTSFK